MSIQVVPGHEGESDHPSPDPSPESPWQNLRDQAESNRQSRFFEHTIPGYEPELVLRLGPVTSSKINGINKRRTKQFSMEEGRSVHVGADLIIESCLGVFSRIDDRLVSTKDSYVDEDGRIVGTPLTFKDERLAHMLGIEPNGRHSEVECVRTLFTTDGDIEGLSVRLLKFNGFGDLLGDEEGNL